MHGEWPLLALSLLEGAGRCLAASRAADDVEDQ